MDDGTPLAGCARRSVDEVMPDDVEPHRRRVPLAAGVAVAVLLTTACASGGDTPASVDTAPRSGGVLNLILRDQLDHLDPAQMYVATAMNISRVLNRTLTTFKVASGVEGSEIVPDLATDLGRSSDGGRTWEFTLKKGVTWEDGSPITCAHLKYGIERRFAPEYDSGPAYPMRYLANTAGYKGPYVAGNNGGKGLAAIECLSGSTVRFTLRAVVSDFPYSLTMPVWAPVSPEHDSRAEYDRRPFASGPYKIAQPFDGQGGPMVLERNPHWNPSTDEVRKAYPDTINVLIRKDQDEEVINELIKDTGDAQSSIALQLDATPGFVQQIVNDPALSQRTVMGTVPGTNYLAINTTKIADRRCRQALAVAFNKRRFRSMLGGSIFGDYATTMIPPDLRSHKKFDVFGVGAAEEGDPDKAVALMGQAAQEGKACPKRLTANFADTKRWHRAMSTLVESYAAIDVIVTLVPIPPATYYTTIGVPSKQADLVVASWLPDWPSGSSVIPPVFDGRLIPRDRTQTGNANFSLLNDTEINKKIDEAMAEPRLEKQYALWGELDEEIMTRAPVIPVIHPKIIRIHGSRVHNAFMHPAWGEADISAMWVG